MDFEIIMKDEAYDEIFTLMRNIDNLNSGDEIGAWLLGEWNYEDKKAVLRIDEMIIPKQDVSGSEVDISPESMIDTVKEIGIDKSNRIKAHWHIHPFGNGDTDWSGVDEDKIKDFMLPEKGREIFCFLLSSEDKIKARVVTNYKIQFGFMEEPTTIRGDINNLPVEKERRSKDDALYKKIKARIDEKVERAKYKWAYNGSHYTGYQQLTLNEDKDDFIDPTQKLPYSLELDDKEITLTVSRHFSDWITMYITNSPIMQYSRYAIINGQETWYYEAFKHMSLQETEMALQEELESLLECYVQEFEEYYNNTNEEEEGEIKKPIDVRTALESVKDTD